MSRSSSSSASKLAIVIPTFNESQNLEELVRRIDEALGKDTYVIVVDDNSPDGTGNLAEEIASRRGNFEAIHRPSKLGLGSAYRTGFQHAMSKLGAEILVEMDADLSHDPIYVKEFRRRVEDDGCELVIGSRNIPGGKMVGMGLRRRIVSKGANFLARTFAGVKVKDCTSGFRAYNSRALKEIDFMKVSSEGFSFQVEMVYEFQKRGLKICEEPITYVFRKTGRSKLGGKEVMGFVAMLFHLVTRRLMRG